MKAILRRSRISPKKANLVAGMVRGKKVKDALDILKFMPKKGADVLYKVVQSAAANAVNNFKQSIDSLFITRILVTKGPTLKRGVPISRGRTHPILKRTCHITVEVGTTDGNVPQKPVSNTSKKKGKVSEEMAPQSPDSETSTSDTTATKKASKSTAVKKSVKAPVKKASTKSAK
ncbi:50S ribosomal protein L22 [Candidatus Peregrinibacteria bacterium CG_4_10_14_0_2_um_filter_43_11]|nr:MAG: 50S ribosomal protein L22 [Candidatus Peregrinibacteria bacterium CG_4_10_14_0_2_um_filter_43_11]